MTCGLATPHATSDRLAVHRPVFVADDRAEWTHESSDRCRARAVVITAGSDGAAVDARGWAVRWAETWARAWPSRDAAAIVALQTVDGCHWSSPLAAPHRGRAGLRGYLLDSFANETQPTRCGFAAPIVDGHRASVEYWAQVEYGGEPATISGCTVLEFDDTGLVARSRDYSFVEPGHVPIATPDSMR